MPFALVVAPPSFADGLVGSFRSTPAFAATLALLRLHNSAKLGSFFDEPAKKIIETIHENDQ